MYQHMLRNPSWLGGEGICEILIFVTFSAILQLICD